jgi:hypothetical protein
MTSQITNGMITRGIKFGEVSKPTKKRRNGKAAKVVKGGDADSKLREVAAELAPAKGKKRTSAQAKRMKLVVLRELKNGTPADRLASLLNTTVGQYQPNALPLRGSISARQFPRLPNPLSRSQQFATTICTATPPPGNHPGSISSSTIAPSALGFLLSDRGSRIPGSCNVVVFSEPTVRVFRRPNRPDYCAAELLHHESLTICHFPLFFLCTVMYVPWSGFP